MKNDRGIVSDQVRQFLFGESFGVNMAYGNEPEPIFTSEGSPNTSWEELDRMNGWMFQMIDAIVEKYAPKGTIPPPMTEICVHMHGCEACAKALPFYIPFMRELQKRIPQLTYYIVELNESITIGSDGFERTFRGSDLWTRYSMGGVPFLVKNYKITQLRTKNKAKDVIQIVKTYADYIRGIATPFRWVADTWHVPNMKVENSIFPSSRLSMPFK